MSIIEINKWLKTNSIKNKLYIKKVKLNELSQWKFNGKKIFHKKNNFFNIQAFNFKKKNFKWSQPLIVQKESGILGIIKKRIKDKDYYLLQAKNEPGNIGGLQISPTVQATKSNYLRKHGGKKTPYLSFFNKKNIKNRILSKSQLSEQGTRFLEKFNNNILVETKNKIFKRKNFYWFTKKDIKKMLKKKNVLNMDTISVFSSVIQKNSYDNPLNNANLIKLKLKNFKKENKILKNKTYFNDLKHWKVKEDKIYHIYKKFFTIFFFDIIAYSREVKKWNQPILSDFRISINCFITCNIQNTLHYLLKISAEPGLKSPKFTSTICERNISNKFNKSSSLMSFFNKKNTRLDVTYSDEGGRFYENESRNLVGQIPNYKTINSKKNFVWVSHNQIVGLIKRNLITIEARNLFAAYNIDKIK